MNETEEFLEHYGVKGMRWGVRKDRDLLGSSGSLKEKIDKELSKPKTPEQERKIKEAEKTFEKKFEKSEDDNPKGWRPTSKQVAITATGAVAVGLIIYKIKTGDNLYDVLKRNPFSVEDYMKEIPSSNSPKWLKEYSGKKLSIDEYKGLVATSRQRIWTNTMVTKESFDHKTTSIKEGHQFFRVSHGVEKSFGPATYTLSSKEDLARYALGWKNNEINVVSFKAKKEIKIAGMYDELEAMREVLIKEGKKPRPKDVIEAYNQEVGNAWSLPRAQAFIETLKGKGFDAIIDHMDAGVYGETPLVLFSPEKMTSKTTTLAKDYDFKSLVPLLSEIQNRR